VSSNGHAQDAADQHLKEFKEKLAHQEYELKVIESVIHVIQRQLKAAGVSAC
jgi:SOS response regulatory protein OraA/RecX